MDTLRPVTSWNDYAEPQTGVQVTSDTHDENVVVEVRGDLDLASAPAFLERIRTLLNHPAETLTINLADVTFVDSAGIDVLNQLRLLTADHALPFALAAVPPCVQRVLENTNMDGLFTYR